MEGSRSYEESQRWREAAGTHTRSSPVNATSTCAKLCGDCEAFYRQLLRQLNERESVSKALLTRLTRNFETLVLWANDYGLLRGNLDQVFACSRATRRCYLESMTGLCTTLLHRLLPLFPEVDMGHRTSALRGTLEHGIQYLEETYPNEDYVRFGQDASCVSPGDNIDEVIQDLEVDLDDLRELDPLLTSPVLDPSAGKRAASAAGVPTLYQPSSEQMRSMSAKAQEDTDHWVDQIWEFLTESSDRWMQPDFNSDHESERKVPSDRWMQPDFNSDHESERKEPSSPRTPSTVSSYVPTESSGVSERIDPEDGRTLYPTHTTKLDCTMRYEERTGPAPDSDYAASLFTHRSGRSSISHSPPPHRTGPSQHPSSFMEAMAVNDRLTGDTSRLVRMVPVSNDRPLWCELRNLSGCQKEFSIVDTDLWVEHHASHFGDRFPSELVCWFCDHVRFVAVHRRDRYNNFVNRMQHIRQHIWDEYHVCDEMRPDYRMIRHMREIGLISEEVHDVAMAYSELPDSMQPFPKPILKPVPQEAHQVLCLGPYRGTRLKLPNVVIPTDNKSELPSKVLSKVLPYTLQDGEKEVDMTTQKEENPRMEESQEQRIQLLSDSFILRAEEAHQRQIAAQAWSVQPKPEATVTQSPASPASSTQHKTTTGKAQIMKSTYHRPKFPVSYCLQCDDYPQGFRGEKELRRHTVAKHESSVQKFICAEPDNPSAIPDGIALSRGLENCKHCMTGKLYGAYYNAAAHLRRSHFKVKGGKGLGGGDWPPMAVLRLWMRQVEVPNEAAAFDERAGSDGGDQDISGDIGVAGSKLQESKEPDESEDRSNTWFRDTLGTPHKDDVGPIPGRREELFAPEWDTALTNMKPSGARVGKSADESFLSPSTSQHIPRLQ